MSGGHWDYLSQKIEDRADEVRYTVAALELLAAIEHELDWGICSDTCYECAKLRVVPAIEEFFDHRACDASAAIAVARDRKQNLCPRCTERERKS